MLTSKDKELANKEASYLAPTQKIPYYPIMIESGHNAIVRDVNGKEYIDFLSSASSANIGHGNKEIAKAIYDQALKIVQYTIGYFSSEEPILLAERLVSLLCKQDSRCLFTTSGSASNDGAIKLARAFTGRSKIIAYYSGYYGSTYGALSLSAISLNMRRKIGPLLPDIFHFEYPNCYRCFRDLEVESCNLECLQSIEKAFTLYLPPEEVAAIFFEPIAGDGGIIVPPLKYVQALRALCDKHGILLVVDEIQQGLGRAGKWLSINHFDVEPDIITLGKSLGGGLPMGCIIARNEIMDSLEAPAHIFTMAGNATVSAAANKMLDIVERDNLIASAVKKGAYILQRLSVMKQKYDIIGDVRGRGLSIAVDLVQDQFSKEPHNKAAMKICGAAIERGLILIFVAKSSLRIQPPLTISYEEIDQALQIIENAISDFCNDQLDDSYLEIIKGW